jgi:hypothetical protein
MQCSLQAIERGMAKQQTALIERLTDEKTNSGESLRAPLRLLIDEIVEELSPSRQRPTLPGSDANIRGKTIVTYNIQAEGGAGDQLRFAQLEEVLDDTKRHALHATVLLAGDPRSVSGRIPKAPRARDTQVASPDHYPLSAYVAFF